MWKFEVQVAISHKNFDYKCSMEMDLEPGPIKRFKEEAIKMIHSIRFSKNTHTINHQKREYLGIKLGVTRGAESLSSNHSH